MECDRISTAAVNLRKREVERDASLLWLLVQVTRRLRYGFCRCILSQGNSQLRESASVEIFGEVRLILIREIPAGNGRVTHVRC